MMFWGPKHPSVKHTDLPKSKSKTKIEKIPQPTLQPGNKDWKKARKPII